MTNEELTQTVTKGQTVSAIGALSAELAARADAWNGNAPEWFPEPPEWLELWEKCLSEAPTSPDETPPDEWLHEPSWS